MQQRLDFLVIGAQKCATSWMYYCLRDHPDLVLPRRKREVEYLGGALHQAKGSDWYFSLFEPSSSHKRIGDVSVEYIFDPRSPQAIYKHARDVKFIVSLREPIERAISAFYWYMRKGLIPKMTVAEALAAGLRCMGGTPESRGCNDYHRDMITRGFYDEQLQRYLGQFTLSQFFFVAYDDIKIAPLKTIQSIYSFIGVDSRYVPKSLELRPKQNTYSAFLVYLERLAPRSRIFSKLLDFTNQRVHHLGVQFKEVHLPKDLLIDLLQLYLPHNKKMAEIIGRTSQKMRTPNMEHISAWSNRK